MTDNATARAVDGTGGGGPSDLVKARAAVAYYRREVAAAQTGVTNTAAKAERLAKQAKEATDAAAAAKTEHANATDRLAAAEALVQSLEG